ncbi:MAG: hypothetical protein IJ064_03175 [Bacteroidaceae bacterium]|nr:hypothetical protein [Bacteroidaceae bacterium]
MTTEPLSKPEDEMGNTSVNVEDSATSTKGISAEEAARDWWHSHYGEPMPEEMIRWMKHLVRTEARRQNIAQQMLSPQQIQRIEDAQRLAETKLRNIENSLQRLHDQQDWVRQFNEKSHELTEHRNRLYAANKQLATMSEEEKKLTRFETFETIQGTFQRMTMAELLRHENKQQQGLLSRDMEEARQAHTDEQKRLKGLTDNLDDARRQMLKVCEQMEDIHRLLGARVVLDLDETMFRQATETLTEQKTMLTKETEELENELQKLQEDIALQSTRRQSMEPHQWLMENGLRVLALLEWLNDIRHDIGSLKRLQQEHLQRQQEENDMLNRVFAAYQDVESDIKTLNEELYLHRQQNLGRNSYSLQERAMQLRSRRQMLLSAQSLWNRIQYGYQMIEEKAGIINRLRLNIDKLRHDIEDLENKVEPMRQLCSEKSHTLALSKSQNVIQLRSDLKEGVSCIVCGASHHPYHSDTMLEQSKLIQELRTEYELLKAELTNKENLLRECQDELMAETARYEVEEESLRQLKLRQMEDVKEWELFAPLDRSFKDCSPSTNAEARTSMLRQLIENTGKDADTAAQDLEEFNFHQTRINEISESLTQKEQKKNDLTTRLTEVNTGCQVLAHQVEQNRQQQAILQANYTHLYEKLDRMITLPDWYREWQNSHESLCMRISQMMENWNNAYQEIARMEQRKGIIQVGLEEKRNAMAHLDAQILRIRENRDLRNNMQKEDARTLERIVEKHNPKEFFHIHYQLLEQAIKEEEEQRDTVRKTREQLSEMEGRQHELENMGRKLDEKSVAERSKLDIWMRQFNANHPPVQYVELERAFTTDYDWNDLRKRIRDIRIEAMLEQARVDHLRSAIVALQANGTRPNSENIDEAIASIVSQQKQQEKQRQEVLMQLAEQHIALSTHKACIARLKAEEEEMYERLKS